MGDPAGLATLVCETWCSKQSSRLVFFIRKCILVCLRGGASARVRGFACSWQPTTGREPAWRGAKVWERSSWDCPSRPGSGSSMATAMGVGWPRFKRLRRFNSTGLPSSPLSSSPPPLNPAWGDGGASQRAAMHGQGGTWSAPFWCVGFRGTGDEGVAERWDLTHHNFGLSAGGSSPPTIPGPIASITSLDKLLPAADGSQRQGRGLDARIAGASRCRFLGVSLVSEPNRCRAATGQGGVRRPCALHLGGTPGVLPHGCQGPLFPLRGRLESRARLGGKSGSQGGKQAAGPAMGPWRFEGKEQNPARAG